jgi:sodium transport system permease protein
MLSSSTQPSKRAHAGLDWRQVRVLYLREMRGALRERAIVLNSILIPVFLYPFLLWAAFTGLTFVMGQTEGFVSRVAVPEWPAAHPGLRLRLERDEQVQLSEATDSAGAEELKIKKGTLDAVLKFLPADATNSAFAGNFKAQILYNQSLERSAQAKTRLSDAVQEYRGDWLRREARRRGIGRAEWQGFTISSRNVATGGEIGAFIMGMIAPVIFVVMVAVGCFYPAVDATAGERERNTWETLMSTAAARGNIVVAKYLYVASMGGVAGILNLLAVIVTLKPIFAPLIEKTGRSLEYTLPVTALPVVVIAGVLLAGFVAAGMMIFAAFARTFKEGQSMIMPFYMLILVPIVFLQAPGLQFSRGLAFVPVVNLTLLVRQAVSGPLNWATAGITVAVSVGLIAVALGVVTFILQFEDVVTGTYAGSFLKLLKERVLRRKSQERNA